MSLLGDRWMGLMICWKPFHPAEVATVKELIAAGKLAPVIDRRFALKRGGGSAPVR